MQFDQKFLINENLAEIDPLVLLKKQTKLQDEYVLGKLPQVTGEVPLISSTGVVPGYRYPSSQEGNSDFYLPKYAPLISKGRYTTRLELFPPSDDLSLAVGSLTVEVQQKPLQGDGAAARIMDHDVNLRIGYCIPLEETDAAFKPVDVNSFVGQWRNYDPDTDGVLDLTITLVRDSRVNIHAVQNLAPTPLDLGTVIADVSDGMVVALFRTADKTVSLNIYAKDGRIRVTEHSDISDPRAEGDFVAHHSFGPASGEEQAFFWIDLEPASPTTATVRKSITPISDMEDYLRLYQVLTSDKHLARLEIKSVVTVGRKSLQQVFVGTKDRKALLEKTNKLSFKIESKDAKEIRSKATSSILASPSAVANPKIKLEINKTTPVRTPAADARAAVRPATLMAINPAVLRAPVAGAVVQPRVVAQPAMRRDGGAQLAQLAEMARKRKEAKEAAEKAKAQAEATKKARERAEALRKASESEALTLQFNAFVVQKLVGSKMPPWVMIEPNGEPVLTRRQAECVQYIAPFWFDLDRDADLFDAPEDIAGGLVLLRHELRAGSRSATFFQDGLSPRQVYYEPQEFRLARSDSSPYAPMMLFHLNEEVDEEADTDDATQFSVTLSYQAKPFIHDSLFDSARVKFGEDALIAPIVPAVSSLTIRMPGGDGSAGTEITREGVEIDFSDGITDIITFSETEYRQLTAAFQTVSGIGLEGHVDVTFLDGRTGQIPLRIGLRNTIGEVFTSNIEPISDSEDVTVQLKNRIESSVKIENLPVVSLAEGAQAIPVDPPPEELIAPAQSVAVKYRVTPPGSAFDKMAAVSDFSVTPDILAILSQTTVVQGYADDTFDVTVSIDPMFFEFVPEGVGALTAVEVSFRTLESPVTLAADTPSVVVSLPMPLLLFLTNADEAQHYSYSVQNIHADGPGSATAFIAGSGNLEVEPAPPENGTVS